MIGGISSASILSQTITALNNEQATMSDLTMQLSTGIKSNDLTRYSPYEASSLLSSKGLVTKYESYKAAIQSVQPRLSVYSSSLAALGKTANTVQGLINGAQNFTSAIDTGLPQQLASALDQASYYLNQKVGERYIYAGVRYQTKPVADLRALPLPPSGTFPVVSPNLPPYDTQAPTPMRLRKIGSPSTIICRWIMAFHRPAPGYKILFRDCVMPMLRLRIRGIMTPIWRRLNNISRPRPPAFAVWKQKSPAIRKF